MDPKDLNLYVEVTPGGAQGDAQRDAQQDDTDTALADAAVALTNAAGLLSRSVGRSVVAAPAAGEPTALAFATKQRLQGSLQSALREELSRQGATLGLNPGDLVAISSSVGQSVSF